MPKNKTHWSRRHFLKATGVASLGSIVTPMIGMARTAERDTVIPTRPFGKTGAQVSILSLGGMFDIASNQLLMKQAMDWGVTYWDTADCYQRGSEKGIGRFLSRQPDARKKLFIVSKSDARDPDGMTRLLDRSLDRMKTDYVDLYFVHAVYRIDELDERTKAWAEKAKADGKIRFFGFSTHSNMEACLLEASRMGWIDGIMMTYNYRLMHSDDMRRAVDACVEAGIGLTAMKTQGGGQVKTDSESELKLAGRFLQKGFTDAQAKLKAVWQNPQISSICSQMPNMSLLMANVSAALDKTQLSARDNALLQRYAQETRSAYCTGCSAICESCVDGETPIGDVMRYLMYAHSYDDKQRAVAEFNKISTDVRARLTRLDYSMAERRCPQRLPIAQLIQAAIKTLAT
ncbi:MAG: aldo/keto reductase [Desulfobacterales bacterium]